MHIIFLNEYLQNTHLKIRETKYIYLLCLNPQNLSFFRKVEGTFLLEVGWRGLI